jgi:hypothetical protein
VLCAIQIASKNLDKMDTSKYESWWTEDQTELAADRSKKWSKTVFKPTPGIWLPAEGGRLLEKYEEGMEIPESGHLDPRAWDHEHCELCYEKISDLGDAQREGYLNQDGQWVCTECFQKYIARDEETPGAK